jgi:hypothetical protein
MSIRRGLSAGILGLLLLAIVEFGPSWSSDPNSHWMVLSPCDIRLDDFKWAIGCGRASENRASTRLKQCRQGAQEPAIDVF